MRLVQLTVSDDRVDTIRDDLSDREIAHRLAAGVDGETLVYFAIPADAVNHVLEDLYENGLEEDDFVSVIDAEFTVSESSERLQERYAQTPNRISPRSLRSKVRSMQPNTRAFVWMMFLSTLVATGGLLSGSPAIVVGSMVIAPIVSPALATSVGTVWNDHDLFVDGVGSQAIGLAIAVVGAMAFGVLLRFTGLAPSTLELASIELVSVRLAPGVLDTVVATSAGAAAAYGLATTGRTTIVGVMIAAALIPTAATVGIAVAWWSPVLAVGAFVLLLLNVAAINVASYATFLYLEYREEIETERSLFTLARLRSSPRLAAAVLAALVVLGGVGAATAQNAAFERAVNEEVTSELDQSEYASLALVDVRTEYVGVATLPEPRTVTVVVSRTGDASHPELAERLRERIDDRTERPVAVRVQFVDYSTAGEG